MEVSMRIRTSKEGARVYISGSMHFQTVGGIDEFLTTVQVARDWLKKQPRQIVPEEK